MPEVSVQDVLGSAGEPPAFEWEGKTYKLGFLTQRAKARFEELVVQAETASIRALKDRGIYSEDEYRRDMRVLGKQIARREYRTGGPLWAKYVGGEVGEQGLALYILSLFREHHPDMTEETVSQMLSDEPEFLAFTAERVVPGFFDYLASALKTESERTGATAKKEQVIAAFRAVAENANKNKGWDE